MSVAVERKDAGPRSSTGRLPTQALRAGWNDSGPRPAPGRRCARALRACSVGFTLIEILIVTAIIGIGLTVVIANLQPDDAQAVRRDAGELAVQLEQLQERAVFGGKAVAVSFNAEGLQTWQRTPKGEWAADAASANIRVGIESLKIGADVAESDARLVFLPDGVSLPFELVVARQGHRFLIAGNPLGRIEMKPAT